MRVVVATVFVELAKMGVPAQPIVQRHVAVMRSVTQPRAAQLAHRIADCARGTVV